MGIFSNLFGCKDSAALDAAATVVPIVPGSPAVNGPAVAAALAAAGEGAYTYRTTDADGVPVEVIVPRI
jgi:hypothetical protein